MDTRPYTPRAIRWAVLQNSLQQPIVLYPLVLAILALLADRVFAVGRVADYVADGLLALAGCGALFEGLWRYPAHSMRYLRTLHEQLEREKQQKMASLSDLLEQVACHDGARQLQLLQTKYQNFQEILASKLSVNEMTYARYLGIAEQVYLAILDNLDRAFFALKSASAIDTHDLQQQLAQLTSPTAEEKRQALTQRLMLHQQQHELANALLLQNEQALTELDHITAKIAQVQLNKGRADMDLKLAMEEMKHLAERTDQYSRK